MDIRHPEAWIDAFLEDVPEANRESFGQVQAFREYGDCIAALPYAERERLWNAFSEAMDERFPSRKTPLPEPAGVPRAAPRRVSDEEILDRVLPVFQAPGDQSSAFHEMLFNRAMGQVDRDLDGEGFLARRLRRKRIATRIRRWMRANL